MKGKYYIEIWNKKVKFRLDIERQITIIRGNSSTGKSYFIELLKMFLSKVNYGVKLKTDFKEIRVYTSFNEELLISDLRSKSESVFVIEEDVSFVKTLEFANHVNSSNNYYIIVNREDFPLIPYSIWSIYEFESSKVVNGGKHYTSTYLRSKYGDSGLDKIKPDILITEDSGVGCNFFKNSLNCLVDTSKGNSSISRKMFEILPKYDNIALMVDGSAFGCYVGNIDKYLKGLSKDVTMFAPESFEYLVLKSGIFKNSDLIHKILDKPYDYCDTTKYFSWERMFTSLLKTELKYQLGIDYSKGSNNEKLVSLLHGYRRQILSELPLLDDSVIK